MFTKMGVPLVSKKQYPVYQAWTYSGWTVNSWVTMRDNFVIKRYILCTSFGPILDGLSTAGSQWDGDDMDNDCVHNLNTFYGLLVVLHWGFSVAIQGNSVCAWN